MPRDLKLFRNPTEDFIVEVNKMFSIGDGIISVGNEEIRDIISGCDNVIISFCKPSGQTV